MTYRLSCWWNITWDVAYYHGSSPPASVSHINLRHRLIRFPINFYSSLIHHNKLLIIITAMSSEDISMQPIPSGPLMPNLSSRFSIDTADIIEAHWLHNMVHFLLPPTPSVSTLAQSSTSILQPSTNLVLGNIVYFGHSPQPYVFLGVTNYFRTNDGHRVYEAEYMLSDSTEPLCNLYLIHPSGYKHCHTPSKYAWWFSFKLRLKKLCHCCCCDANDYSLSPMV